MLLANTLRTPDVVFFISCAAIVVICVVIYFLIPVIKKKEFEEKKANLKKREETFRKNLKNLRPEVVVVTETETTEESDFDNIKTQLKDAINK